MIEAVELSKEYKTALHGSGAAAALRSFIKPEYKITKAVDCISFALEAGTITGFIGANGAGKSTTIKMMTGILAPTSGTIRVNSQDPFKDRKKNAFSIGAVFGQRTQLMWDIPVRETFCLLQKMYRIEENSYRKNLTMFCDILDLGSFIDKPARQLSLGQRMRADICAALLHNPPIVFLDEPTIGLDVSVKDYIRKFILQVNKERNTTFILTTHDITDIEELSQQIMIIDGGHIIYRGDISHLKKEYGRSSKIMITVSQEEREQMKDAFSLLPVTLTEGEELTIEYSPVEISSEVILFQLFSDYHIRNFRMGEVELEEIIRSIYRKK